MSRNLTKKQRGFVKDYLKTGNGTQSALKHYNINTKHGTTNPLNVAHSIAVENLQKPAVIKAIAERIDDDLLFDVHYAGLQAERISEDGSNIADHSVRHKFLDTAYKLKGSFAPEKHAVLTVDVTNDKLIALAEALNKASNKGI